MLSVKRYAGLRADLFPAVSFTLVSADNELIPAERGLIRANGGDSYWDVALSSGKVWSEKEDRGYSRAVFPLPAVEHP